MEQPFLHVQGSPMKNGTIVRVRDACLYYPQLYDPENDHPKIGLILEELPRLPGGPTKFKVLIGDSIHTFPIHTLEQK